MEAVAEPEDCAAAIDEFTEGIAEVLNELVGEDLSAGDVIAVTEPAGNGQDLIIGEEPRALDKTINVCGIGECTGLLPGVSGLFIAIDSRGAKHEDADVAAHGKSVADSGGEGMSGRGICDLWFFDLALKGFENTVIVSCHFFSSVLLCVALAVGASCRPAASRSVTSAPSAPRRIISISPNSTEIIAALGAADRLVAVSDFCVWPESVKKLPRVGGLFDVNLEAVLKLQPDLIVLRGRHHGVEQLCASSGIRLYRDRTESLADIFTTLDELGEILDCRAQAAVAQRTMRDRLATISKAVERRSRPRVLMTLARNADAISSVMVGGRGTFVDDMIAAAGGQNAFGDLSAAYPGVSQEAILVARPEVIIDAMPETKPTPELEAKIRRQWKELGPLPAVEKGRVYLLCDENATIPSPRIVDVIAKLARLFHPEAAID